jgi:hypothetical protein
MLATAASLVCAGFVLANVAPAKPPEPSDFMRAAVMPVRSPNHMSTPEAGIKLLEDIIQRVKNVPQLAMAKQGLKYQAEQSAASLQQGPTDYRLAIRPQEQSPKQALKPAVDRNSKVLAWGTLPATPVASSMDVKSNAVGGYAPVYGDEGGAANSKGFWERDVDKQAKRKEVSAEAESAPSVTDGFTNAQGIWERERENAESAVNRLSPESRDRISAPAGKLFNLAQGLDAVQQSAERGIPASKASEEAKSKGAVLAKRSQVSMAQRPAWYRSAPQLQMIDDRPTVRDFREAPSASGGYAVAGAPAGVAGGGGAAAAPSSAHSASSVRGGLLPKRAGSLSTLAMAGNSPSVYPTPAPPPPAVAGTLNSRVRSDALARQNETLRFKDSANKKSEKTDRIAEVALLPPNVVTGIPLVHLGYSEAQTTQALGTLGSAARHTGSGWTVLTFSKAHSNDAALQVYIRHGQVEALRIFDPALIGPDFGVTLGSDLSSVKLKFGEPTFILSEPFSGQGQNYVYPISQVAFQLSRPARGKLPQVISLLIFNVK